MNLALVTDDLHLMLIAWNAGTPQARDVALDIADRNRRAALTTPLNLSTSRKAEHDRR